MGGEWRDSTLGDLCDAGDAHLQTGPFGTQLHAHDYVDDGIPVVPTEAIRNRQIDHTVLPQISLDKADELRRHRLELGDILFARRGVQATGHIGYVREGERGFICGTGAIRLRIRSDNRTVTADFLSHVLANPASVDWFKFHAIGATMPNLNEGIIRSFPVQIPPLSEQRAIAHILGTLDDKIELNRRMNETLEAMARALFQSWFVDFDPVRAKAEGRDPSLTKPLADLFPDSFEDSELGEIPSGWEAGSFGNLMSQRSERVGQREVVVLSAVASGVLARSDDHFTKRVYSKDTGKYLLVEQWDFAYNPSRINIGSIGLLEEAIHGGVSPVYVVVRPRPSYRWFLEFSIRLAHTKVNRPGNSGDSGL